MVKKNVKLLNRIVIFGLCILTYITMMPKHAVAEEDKPSWLYSTEINFRMGVHIYEESPSWVETQKETLDNDMFFRNDTSCSVEGQLQGESTERCYQSNNVDTNFSAEQIAMPMFSFEYLMGIDVGKNIRGFRVGLGFTYYPIYFRENSIHSGAIKYNNTDSSTTSTGTIDYNGKISIEETLLVLVPSANLYYYYEDGFGSFKPYLGVEFGSAIMTGKRKYILTSDQLTTSSGSLRQIDSAIQETFINATSVRVGTVLGGQMHLSGPHLVDFRFGAVQQDTPVELNRRGTWNENIDGSAYSRGLSSTSKTSTYSQTGIYFTLGYTMRLL